jgi:GT2 family glycosyltransferase
MHDLCAIVVSHNGKGWLDAALSSLYDHAEGIDLDLVVVDNGADGSADYVAERFPAARTLRCANHGFGHANNRGLETADARYVLFLNPDTEFLVGDLGDLLAALDRRPAVGLAGVRQVESDGSTAPSIRRLPASRHAFAEALGVERLPGLRQILGERELDQRLYARETPCGWTSGSFMLARAEALAASGGFDERFFLFSEETDLCQRISAAGWQVMHMPGLTIRHYEAQGVDPRLEAQSAYSRLQYARKHLTRPLVYRCALALRYGLRAWRGGARGAAARRALRTVVRPSPPFGELQAPPQAPIVGPPGYRTTPAA